MKIVSKELDALLDEGIIFNFGDYYMNTNNPILVAKREKGNAMAKTAMPKAMKMANKISQFPFVRGVSFSGAFSKGYFDEEGDIDFFIITEKNRLWIARTLLILYKKVFLLNSKKYFCVNYFISDNKLKIAEKNKFTAMELITLIPTHGKKVFEYFYIENLWVHNYFPNASLNGKLKKIKNIKPSFIKKSLEFILNFSIGTLLESFFRKITLRKWQSKFNHIPKEEFEVAMKSTSNVSKHHPNNYQKKVIETLNASYFQVNKTHQIVLEPEHA